MVRVLARTTRRDAGEAGDGDVENFETDRRFDLLYAAASWHWTDPVTCWARPVPVELLAAGGVLALFGRSAEPNDPDLAAAIDEIEKHEDDPAVIHPWSIEEMSSTDGLADSTQHSLRCVVTTTAADFPGRPTTVSASLLLTPRGPRRGPAPATLGRCRLRPQRPAPRAARYGCHRHDDLGGLRHPLFSAGGGCAVLAFEQDSVALGVFRGGAAAFRTS